jgi:hypothetical protein
VFLGSVADLIVMDGVIEAFGGINDSFIAGGGTLTFVSDQTPTFGTGALFNGNMPLSGPRDDSDIRASLSLSDFILAGGGGGGGGGGPGMAIPEPGTVVLMLLGLAIILARVRSTGHP